MKELSIEEKARRYDEAIEKFDVILNLDIVKESGTIFADDVRKILPELAESEDEKIRKALIEACKQSLIVGGFHKDKVIAWLEAQGKHAKFRDSIQVGDKVTKNQDGVLVNLSQLKRVAKPAEVQGEQKPVEPQQDMLSQEKYAKAVDECIYGEKSEWSEEDETTKNNISHIIRQYDKISKIENQPCYYVGDCLLWMQNIKDRVQPQPKQEWNYNDEIIIGTIIQEIEKIPSEKFIDNAKYRCLDWLRYRTKSLRPHSQWKPSDEQMQVLVWCRPLFADPKSKGILESLINDLKKLMEE